MRLRLALTLFIGLMMLGASPARAGDALLTLLDPYFRIQSALSDDKTDGVAADAASIATSAATLGEAGKPIVLAAKELGAAADLGAARAAFGKLSDAVVSYSESTKASAGEGVTAMYCPMAKKQWLQKGEQVSNPYYGKSMLSCGEKKKTKTKST
jgi:hypothetical protein